MTVLRTRKETDFLMCRKLTKATPDILLEDMTSQIYILVAEDKSVKNKIDDPQAQVFAEVISAVQHNNTILRTMEIQVPDPYDIWYMTVSGTHIGFYRCSIPKILLQSIETGQVPPKTTKIDRYVKDVGVGLPIGFDFLNLDDRATIFNMLTCIQKQVSKLIAAQASKYMEEEEKEEEE